MPAPVRAQNASQPFTSAAQIQAGLSSDTQEGLTRSLTTLRNQFTFKGRISPQDSRLSLVQEWLSRSPGANDLFLVWENATQPSIASLAISVLSSTLTLLSSHYTYHVLGYPILKTLFQPQWSRKLNSYLGQANNDLTLWTLKLFNSMSHFASGKERKTVLERFPWELKSLPKLLHMRRRNKNESDDRPDIRTLYIYFLLSFIDSTSPTSLKTTFLESYQDKFLSFFKGLTQDSYAVIRRVLETSWAGVWSEAKLKRTLKLGVFHEGSISHLSKLYERDTAETDNGTPADLVHHFLLAICTRPGTGLCFRDRGWYPREEEEGGKIYNKILSNVIKTLKPNEDARQQELVIKILEACPELVATYWHAAALTLEPRLSSKWIANIALFGTIISLPVPTSTFYLTATEYNPSPPPINTIMENILPSVNTKSHLTKGLSLASSLVKHSTALALIKCLTKFRSVTTTFACIADELEEKEEEGEWRKRIEEVKRETRKRVPDLMVVLAFSQHAKDGEGMLKESATRLVWLYHELLPEVVREARFDVGKVLIGAFEGSQDGGWGSLVQLHTVKLLGASEEFVWSASAKGEQHSYIHTLLTAYANPKIHPSVHAELGTLLARLLGESHSLFDGGGEVRMWLQALPRSEPGNVIDLLETCIQKCIKSPGNGSLLQVVLEHLPSVKSDDALEVVTFLRKLLFRLDDVKEAVARVEEVFKDGKGPAVKREVEMIRVVCSETGSVTVDETASKEIISSAESVEEVLYWVRHASPALSPEDVKRLVELLRRLDPPAIKDFLESLDPSKWLLWDVVREWKEEVLPFIDFDWLLFSSSPLDLEDAWCRDVLTGLVKGDAKRAVRRIVTHGTISREKVLLIASIMESRKQEEGLKEYVFQQCQPMKDLCVRGALEADLRDALQHLLNTSLNPENTHDRSVVTEICNHWQSVLILWAQTNLDIPITLASLWLPLMSSDGLFNLLVLLDPRKERSKTVLLEVLEALRVHHVASSPISTQRLQLLSSLRQHLPSSTIVEDMIAAALTSSSPLCLDGKLKPEYPQTLDGLVRLAEERWSRRLEAVTPALEVATFLEQEKWSDATVKIITYLLSRGATISSWTWIQKLDRSTAHLASVLRSYLSSRTAFDVEPEVLTFCLRRLGKTVCDERQEEEIRQTCGECLLLIAGSQPEDVVATLVKVIKKLPKTSMTEELLQCGIQIHAMGFDGARPVHEALTDHGLQWAVEEFSSEGDDVYMDRKVRKLASLVKIARSLKIHLIEPLLTVVIQHRLQNAAALDLLTAVVTNIRLKPLVVNRHLQSIIQHRLFFKVCTVVPGSSLRNSCINVLYELFHLHPLNTCQVSHVEPLIKIYRGTTSVADRRLLAIFQLFETQRKTSISSLLGQWSASDIPSSNALEAIHNLESILVMQTCLHFPRWRCLIAQPQGEHDTEVLYDPVFLLLLLAQALVDNVPDSAPAWIELFRSNVISLVIRSMSSKDDMIRELALSQLAILWGHLQSADMQEVPHVIYILSLLKDAIPPPGNDPPKRLPCYATLMLAHSLRAVFYPSNFIYPHTARFLLQRPTFDVNDVPMLYSMLYSSSDNWKKERAWMIRFLSDGMTSSEDWKVLKRRHTWDLLASLFQSSESDRVLRMGIFEVLANLTSIQQSAMSLILKSALLTWIEMQLVHSSSEEVTAWTKILENLVVMADPVKAETSTNGEWKSSISRCLLLLLQKHNTAISPNTLSLIARVTLRLTLLSGPPMISLEELLSEAIKCLKILETNVDLSKTSMSDKQRQMYVPHRAVGMRFTSDETNVLEAWTTTVEALWRVSMTCTEKLSSWDALTSRVMISAALWKDEELEWARKHVLHNLSSSGACLGGRK